MACNSDMSELLIFAPICIHLCPFKRRLKRFKWNWRPDEKSGLTRTRLLTAACTAATGTVRSGMALPSTSPSSCMMTRWEICWATGSRILSMVLVWNTGIVNDFYPNTHTEGERCLLVAPALRISPLFCVSLSSPPVTDTDRRTDPELSIQPLGASCVSPPGALRLPWRSPRWRLDSLGCPSAGSDPNRDRRNHRPPPNHSQGIRLPSGLVPVRSDARTGARARTHAPTHAHARQVRALPKLRHACQRA